MTDDKRELAPPAKSPAAMIAIAQQREIAEIQARMLIARANPRDEIAARDRIIRACASPVLAELASYEYSRGGSEISGPSIRLAEVLAQNWGNFDFGIRELEQRDGESTVEAYAWDIETNVTQRKTFQVPHTRYTKQHGNKALTDPRDIYEGVANQGARRLRACILGVIPREIQDLAVKQCEATLHTKVDITPERIKSLVQKFAECGVTPEMIEHRIQRRLDAITPALMVQLGRIYNSLKDGMSKPDNWFEEAPMMRPKPLDTPETGQEPKGAATPEPSTQTGEVKPDNPPPPPQAAAPASGDIDAVSSSQACAEVLRRMEEAFNSDDLGGLKAICADFIRRSQKDFTVSDVATMRTAYEQHLEALKKKRKGR